MQIPSSNKFHFISRNISIWKKLMNWTVKYSKELVGLSIIFLYFYSQDRKRKKFIDKLEVQRKKMNEFVFISITIERMARIISIVWLSTLTSAMSDEHSDLFAITMIQLSWRHYNELTWKMAQVPTFDVFHVQKERQKWNTSKDNNYYNFISNRWKICREICEIIIELF